MNSISVASSGAFRKNYNGEMLKPAGEDKREVTGLSFLKISEDEEETFKYLVKHFLGANYSWVPHKIDGEFYIITTGKRITLDMVEAKNKFFGTMPISAHQSEIWKRDHAFQRRAMGSRFKISLFTTFLSK
jgi:hypothetical protein